MSGSRIEGADPEALERLAAVVERGAAQVEGVYAPIRRMFQTSGWDGVDADQFGTEWDGPQRARLAASASALREAATNLRLNAAEQRAASAATFSDARGSVWARAHGAGWFPASGSGPGLALTNGRRTLIETLDASRQRIGQEQIEVRRLPNGKYVVILPGVVDLTEGLRGASIPGIGSAIDELRHGDVIAAGRDAFRTIDGLERAPGRVMQTWLNPDNPYGSVRDMSHAMPTAIDPGRRDEYSDQVKLAMRVAGVPSGAQVMIVGHSYGGYAAMHLAADPTFNRSTAGDGYSVHVTDVVSFGAATSQYLTHIPADTNALVVGNRQDVPYALESLPDGIQRLGALHTELPPNHHVAEFDGTPWVGGGHDQLNYETWLSDAHFDAQTSSILDSIGSSYSGRGEGLYVDVPAVGPPAVSPPR